MITRLITHRQNRDTGNYDVNRQRDGDLAYLSSRSSASVRAMFTSERRTRRGTKALSGTRAIMRTNFAAINFMMRLLWNNMRFWACVPPECPMTRILIGREPEGDKYT